MSVYSVLQSRGVTRLCHFTKLQQLTHILSSGEGILASNSIRPDIKNVADQARYDGELNYVCCSVEYPNSWFLNKAIQRDTDTIFNEWVVILSIWVLQIVVLQNSVHATLVKTTVFTLAITYIISKEFLIELFQLSFIKDHHGCSLAAQPMVKQKY